MKDLASPFSPEPASSVKMFFRENDLDKPQDTGFKKKKNLKLHQRIQGVKRRQKEKVQ